MHMQGAADHLSSLGERDWLVNIEARTENV